MLEQVVELEIHEGRACRHTLRNRIFSRWGFGLVLDPGEVGEVSSAGEFIWAGVAGTRFWIDPQEQLIGIFMVQSIPHRTRLAGDFKVLAYQALVQ